MDIIILELEIHKNFSYDKSIIIWYMFNPGRFISFFSSLFCILEASDISDFIFDIFSLIYSMGIYKMSFLYANVIRIQSMPKKK